MLDELEKAQCALDEAIEKLHEQLEPVLKQADPSTATKEPCGEPEPVQKSVLRNRIETYADQLREMLQTIESMTSRLDIPT